MRRLLRLRHLLWGVPTALIIALASYLLINQQTRNIHTVIPGTLYRSAQLVLQPLQDLVEQHKIKTIINLRGKHPQADWYRGEANLAKQRQLQHDDLKLPAHGLVTHQQLKALVALLQAAPKPILVHCRQGADRTGLVSAIAVILDGNPRVAAATRQVSWRYGVISPKSVGYQVVKNYLLWLKANNASYGKASFLRWVNSSVVLQPQHGLFL